MNDVQKVLVVWLKKSHEWVVILSVSNERSAVLMAHGSVMI